MADAVPVKGLQDFYNPQMMAMGLNYVQGQQHLGLQQQQLAMQQASQAQQGKNLEVDNLQKALQSADPMQSYPIHKKLNELLGLPVQSVNDYYANLPSQKVMRGAKELNVKAGLGDSENLAALTADKPAIQTQVGNVAAQTELQQEQAKALKQKTEEHNALLANVGATLKPLIALRSAAELDLSRVTPHVTQLQELQQEYDKNVKSLGPTKAAGIRNNLIAANPDLQAFEDRRKQSVGDLKQQIQQREDAHKQLHDHAVAVASGIEPLAEGESIERLAGQVDGSVHQLDYMRTRLSMAEDPVASLPKLQQFHAQASSKIEQLTGRINSSRDNLEVRRDAQVETARKNAYGEKLDSVTSAAKRRFAALPTGQQTPQSAARIAEETKQSTGVDVGTDKILEGSKMPNNPLVKIDMKQEGAEAQVVGTEFGKQYTNIQNAAVTASEHLSKLDRMDQLMTGMQTGKLTPALTQVQAIADSFGITLDKTLPAKQAMEALSNEVALSLRNPAGGAGMPGALSDKDREFLASMTPNIGKTPEGNKLIIETARSLAKRSQEVAKMARAYRTKHGHFDEGFLEDLQTYSEKHPLFAGKSAPQSQPQSGAPTIGQMDSGYIFKGGDPSKKENWEKR